MVIILVVMVVIGVWTWNGQNVSKLTYDEAVARAFAFNREGNYKKAAKYYLKAADLDEQNRYNPYRNAGLMYQKLGEFDQAADYLTKAIELEPKSSLVIELMEVYIHNLKKPEEDIIATFNFFLEKVSDNRDIAMRYALYLESVNRYDDALDLYKKALEQEPDNNSLKQSIDFLEKKLKE